MRNTQLRRGKGECVEVRNMRIGKTIGGKLYLGFSLVLGSVIVMSLVNYIAVLHEQNTRALYQKSIKMADNLSKLGQTRLNNRLHLRNFLRNGDGREAEALSHGITEADQRINDVKETSASLGENSPKAKQLLDKLTEAEKEWNAAFATPLLEKRRQVDAGSATVAELQIAYLQATPAPDAKLREEEPLVQLDEIMKQSLVAADDQDRSA